MNGYKIVLLKAIFMLYRLPESERVCSGICNRYFKQEKLQALLEEYSRKSEIRLLIGRCLFFIYCIFTWIGSYVILAYFHH